MKVNQSSFLDKTDFSRDGSFKKSFDLGRSKSNGGTMGTLKQETPLNILEMSNKPRTIKGGQKVMAPAIIQ